MTTFTLDGAAVHGIDSFYDELNRVFMGGEDWRLGASLDALNDLLYGGYGAMRDAAEIRIVWVNHEVSRHALGVDATGDFYRAKLRHPETYDQRHFRALLDELESGAGATYFDIVLEVFADHPEIELVLA